MGKIILTPLQELILSEFNKSNLTSKFYLTGGTALSAFYLKHRLSEDLDFFSEKNFDTQEAVNFIDLLSAKIGLKYRFTQIVDTRIFEFVKNGKLLIKIDFGYYPYNRLEGGKKNDKIIIDSTKDIATNKLISITSRTEVKDFVDLYFLFKSFTLWDLLYAVEEKFNRQLDLILIASDFMKVEEFEILPKMLVPLQLSQLIDFYRKRAIELGKSVVK